MTRATPQITPPLQKRSLEGWTQCPSCKRTICADRYRRSHRVCGECGHHGRLSSRERIEMLCDPGSFRPSLTPAAFFDPLVFQDTEAYCSRWEGACRKTQLDEAIQWGEAALAQNPIILAVMDFAFMGGSMGSTVGERVALACEAALARHIPLLVVCASGGARMQEGLFSLLQMAKTALSFQRLRDSAIPIISLLTDPTCGGVTASFGTLADLILAEPGALICFTGPRVIEQNLRQKLPEEAQKAEFLLAKGMVDQIVPRERQKEQIARYLGYLRPHV